jgi:SAM-dependent methyltransferase
VLPTGDWLTDTRTSYDTVAADYADLLRDALAADPWDRAVLGLFAELVTAAGPGPVADVGCGPGRITAHLRRLGLTAVGLDLSPAMVAVGRRDHPGLPLAVGSMTALPFAAASLGGLVAWYSVIHVPDEALPGVLAGFARVLRPGGVLLLASHSGDGSTLKTEGYGGHPMAVHVHRRTPERLAAGVEHAGLTVEGRLLRRHADTPSPAGFLLARR